MVINYNRKSENYLDITFQPKWDNIRITKNFLEKYLLVNVFDKKSISKVIMSASELLENAIKNSPKSVDKHGVRLIIKKDSKSGHIELSVFNVIKKSEASLLVKRIDEMNHSEPLDYYLYKMRESIKQKGNTSGDLGLARIHCEGEAKVQAKYDDKNKVLEVKAIF